MSREIIVMAAVEGITDQAVVRKLLEYVQAIPGEVYGKNGKSHLRQRVRGYNNAAHYAPWIVLVDLDRDADCAPPLRHAWLPEPASNMCFRIAVREVEAWLLADRQRISSFLHVSSARIPTDPESLDNPKEMVVNLARQSRRREIRDDMVPRPSSGRQVGQAYSSRLIEFASIHWRPQIALEYSDSLKRTTECLSHLVQRWSSQ